MKVIHYMSDYFFSNKMRNKPLNRAEDNSGAIISFGALNAYTNLVNYTNWLMTIMSYSNEIGVEANKLIDLIDKGVVKGLEWYNERYFISIYKHAIAKPDGEPIGDNFLSTNSELIDKR